MITIAVLPVSVLLHREVPAKLGSSGVGSITRALAGIFFSQIHVGLMSCGYGGRSDKVGVHGVHRGIKLSNILTVTITVSALPDVDLNQRSLPQCVEIAGYGYGYGYGGGA